MKVLYFLSFMLFINTAEAEDQTHSRAELIRLLNRVQGQLEPSVYAACRENVEDVRIVNCGNRHSRVLSDYMISVVQLNRLRNQVRAYSQRPAIRNNSTRRAHVARVGQMLSCLRTESDNLVFTCATQGCGPTTYALNPRGSQGEIQLCPRYFELSRTMRSATILHEVSHDCGALDFEYYYHDNQRVARPNATYTDSIQRIFGWSTNIIHRNADNFRYWVQEGFCLPEYDCRR